MPAMYSLQASEEELVGLQDLESVSESELEPQYQASRFGPRNGLLLALGLGATLCLGALGLRRVGGGSVQASGFSTGLLKKQESFDWTTPAQPVTEQSYQHFGSSPVVHTLKDSPNEDLADGNPCEDDEELFEVLCYKKCSLLTNGVDLKRDSAMSCGKSKGFKDALGAVKEFGICHGFDVAGDLAGGGCPHKPGACLTDEEFHLGECYKKCAVLTQDKFPFRTSAATCCKEKASFSCLKFGQSKLDIGFDVGGGSGTEAKAHYPETKFTEASP